MSAQTPIAVACLAIGAAGGKLLAEPAMNSKLEEKLDKLEAEVKALSSRADDQMNKLELLEGLIMDLKLHSGVNTAGLVHLNQAMEGLKRR